MYEKVLNHYQNREDLETKYTQLAVTKIRKYTSGINRTQNGKKRYRRRRKGSSALDTLMFSGQPADLVDRQEKTVETATQP